MRNRDCAFITYLQSWLCYCHLANDLLNHRTA